MATKMPTVAFATYEQVPGIAEDDQVVANVLRDSGVEVVPIVWDAPEIDWSRFDAVVIRSTWDYHLKLARYSNWLKGFLRQGRLLNPPQAVLGNLNKRYLVDLALGGIEIVPTAFQAACSELILAELLQHHRWDQVVIKPAVSASAWGTWRTSQANAPRDQQRFAQQLRDQDLLIQPYFDEIVDGELSLVFIAGEYSHTALKRPAAGDFRVQRHHGGTTSAIEPSSRLIAQAKSILDTVEHTLLYARVDGIDRDGRFILMELEINEPFLFLGYSEKAAQRFATAIINALGGAAKGGTCA